MRAKRPNTKQKKIVYITFCNSKNYFLICHLNVCIDISLNSLSNVLYINFMEEDERVADSSVMHI